MINHKIDWIAATLPEKMTSEFTLSSYVSLALKLARGVWQRSGGMHGYKLCIDQPTTGIVARGNGNDDAGSHIILSGTALTTLAVTISPDKLIANLVGAQARFARIDLAIDIVGDARANIPELHQLFLADKCTTKSRKLSLVQSGVDGHTMYVGGRTSERFIRIYNKAAERRANGEQSNTDWIRIELELKGARANMCAKSIASPDNSVGDVIAAHIRDFIDFDLSWWGEATSGKSVEMQQSARKLTDTENWLLEQVAPALARQMIKDANFHLRFMDAVRYFAEREAEKI